MQKLKQFRKLDDRLTQHATNRNAVAVQDIAYSLQQSKISIMLATTRLSAGLGTCPSDADCEQIVLKLKVSGSRKL